MPEYEYISIDKTLIPYQFDISLPSSSAVQIGRAANGTGRTFTFHIRYNAQSDFFTIDLYRDGALIVAGEKVVYGRVLFVNQQHLDVPTVPIIPYCLAMNEERVSWENFNETVFLWLHARD